jgi:hypothetical protein
MSITTEHQSLPLRSRSHDAGISGMPSPAHRDSRTMPVKPRPSRVPAVMGQPNHAPGVPIMGAPSRDVHLDVVGSPDVAPRVDLMGGPDTGQRLPVMGESDLTFVDSLFA